MISIVALLVFGVVLALGGVTPELLAPAFFLGLLLVTVWAVRLVFRGDATWKPTPMHLPAALFVAYAVIRYFTTPVLEYDGRLELFQIALFISVYFICSQEFKTATHRKALVFLLAGLAVFEAMYGVWQALSKSDAIFHWVRFAAYRGRASGTYVCPNHLAGCLEIILGLIVARLAFIRAEALSFERSMLVKLALCYSVLVSMAGIMFSQSRGGWVAAAGGLIILTLWGRKVSIRLIWSLIFLFGLFVAIGGLFLATENGQRRLAETVKRDPVTGAVTLKDSTLGGRLLMAEGTIEMIRENPVFGTGPGTWQWLYPRHKNERLQAHPEYAHEDYLNLLSDYGIIGTCMVGWFFVAFFRQARVLGRAGEPPEQRAFALGAVASVSAILIHSAFDFNLHIPANSTLLAVIMGTMAAMDDSAGRYAARPIKRVRFALAIPALAAVFVVGWFFLPTVLSAHFMDIGNGFRKRLEYEWAVYFLQKAIDADPKNPQPQISLGETYLVLATLRIGPEKQESRRELALTAVEAFDQALRLNPLTVAAWLGRGRAYEMAGENDAALDSYQQGLRVDPVNASVFFLIGRCYRDRGDTAKADQAFERSLQLRSAEDAAAFLNLRDLRNL